MRSSLAIALAALALWTPAAALAAGATAATGAAGTAVSPTTSRGTGTLSRLRLESLGRRAGSAGATLRTGAATPRTGATTTTPRLRSPLLGGLPGRGRTAAKARHGGRHISALAIVVAALGALLLAGCAAWALARGRAFEPRWWLSLRHSVAEAGYRASATWSELGDWARLGR